MYYARLVQASDKRHLETLLAHSANPLYSLSPDSKEIAKKIAKTQSSLSLSPEQYPEGYYGFVLVDSTKKSIVGYAGLKAKAGYPSPYYLYRLLHIKRYSPSLDYEQLIEYLVLNNDLDEATELCSLYIHPNHRGQKVGSLLSYARLLFIYHHPDRFGERLFADIRGHSDDKGDSPFWNHLIKPFTPLSQAEEELRIAKGQRQFIMDLLPNFPIYKNLLPEPLPQLMGLPHPEAKGAKHLLEKQGFHYLDYINLLDGGPILTIFKQDLKLFANTHYLRSLGPASPKKMGLVSTADLNTFSCWLYPSDKKESPYSGPVDIQNSNLFYSAL